MEHILNCHKPPFNKWENIYWRSSCHPYVDFCHSLLKVWLNIKMHHHNGSDFDKNSLHIRTLLGRLCNIIFECSSICIGSRWLLDSISVPWCFKDISKRRCIKTDLFVLLDKGSKKESQIYRYTNNIPLAFCSEIYVLAVFSCMCKTKFLISL